MGCFASRAAPDLIIINYEDDEVVGALIQDYNIFCTSTKENLKNIITLSKTVDHLLSRLIESSKQTGSISSKILECFMNLIIFILHNQKSKDDSFQVIFSNYLPGILVNPADLHENIRPKYQNVIKLSNQLPIVFSSFDLFSEKIVKQLSLARDHYPKEFYSLARGNKDISLAKFAEIERDLIDNFEMIGVAGMLLDKMFKNCKNCLRLINEIIEKCDKNIEDVYRIFDGIDEWNYDSVPDVISKRVSEFIVNKDIKLLE